MVCLLVLAAYVASFRWKLSASLAYASIHIGGGIILCGLDFDDESLWSLGVWPERTPVNKALYWARLPWCEAWRPRGQRRWLVGTPFWVPVALVSAPTALLWYLDRRRHSPGHCRKCGYNLTGNVSGRCPECGQTIELKHA